MKKYLLVFILLGGLLIWSTPVHAQSEEVQAARGNVIDSLEAIKTLEDNAENLSEEEYTIQKHDLKKIALDKILTLSILQTDELQEKVDSFEEVDAELIIFQDMLIDDLEEHLDTFEILRTELEETKTLTETQELAGRFEDIRDTTYNDLVSQAVDFTVVFQNRSILKIADARFAKIANELKRIKLGEEKEAAVYELLEGAAAHLQEARGFSGETTILLKEYIPEPEELEEVLPEDDELFKNEGELEDSEIDTVEEEVEIDEEVTEDEIVEAEEEIEEESPSIRDIAQLSLGSIKAAYKAFIDLAKELKQ